MPDQGHLDLHIDLGVRLGIRSILSFLSASVLFLGRPSGFKNHFPGEAEEPRNTRDFHKRGGIKKGPTLSTRMLQRNSGETRTRSHLCRGHRQVSNFFILIKVNDRGFLTAKLAQMEFDSPTLRA